MTPRNLDLEAFARQVHHQWVWGMLNQQRTVAPERLTWHTLPEREKELDRIIAKGLAQWLGLDVTS